MLLVARVRWASAMYGHRRRLAGAGEERRWWLCRHRERVQGACVAGGYGRDRGRGSAPPSADWRHSVISSVPTTQDNAARAIRSCSRRCAVG
jgi:hypothetical protein